MFLSFFIILVRRRTGGSYVHSRRNWNANRYFSVIRWFFTKPSPLDSIRLQTKRRIAQDAVISYAFDILHHQKITLHKHQKYERLDKFRPVQIPKSQIHPQVRSRAVKLQSMIKRNQNGFQNPSCARSHYASKFGTELIRRRGELKEACHRVSFFVNAFDTGGKLWRKNKEKSVSGKHLRLFLNLYRGINWYH